MPDWFSKELHHFTFPPAVGISDFQFLYIFANNYYLRFIQWIVQWYFMVSVCILLMTKNINHFFMSLLAICISSLEKGLFKTFFHFLKLNSVFFVVIGVLNIQDILNIHLSIFSSIQNHTGYTICKYFGPSCGLCFHSLDSVLIY